MLIIGNGKQGYRASWHSIPEPRKEEILEPGNELRIDRIEDHLKILLIEGKAEIFGRELPLKMPLYFH